MKVHDSIGLKVSPGIVAEIERRRHCLLDEKSCYVWFDTRSFSHVVPG